MWESVNWAIKKYIYICIGFELEVLLEKPNVNTLRSFMLNKGDNMTQQAGILTSSLQVIQSLYCSDGCYSFSYLEASGWGKTLKMTYGIPHRGFCQVALCIRTL